MVKATRKYSVGKGPIRRLVPKNKHMLVPDVISGGTRSKDEELTHNDGKEYYFTELEQLASELKFRPIVHRVVMENIKKTIDAIPREDLVMNLCDGSDLDGVPGPSDSQFPNVVGCDWLFINNTLTKNGMKELFMAHHVASPPGFAATPETNIPKLVEEWGMIYPLFVKVSDSYGSVGLDDESVCHNLEQLLNKCSKLFKEFPNLTVEEFIDGPEFSVLVSGNCRDPEQTVIVYPPAERAFDKKLEQYQRFISFHRNWDESALAHSYEPVQDANDYNALQDLARRAYTAVSGNCYGRVDIRKRDINGKFYVLEVNASCGLGKGSSSDFILNLAGQTTKDFFEILVTSSLRSSAFDANATDEELEDSQEDGDRLADLPGSNVVIPSEVEQKVAKLIRHPSLLTSPNPVVHVIVSAILVDQEWGIPDPEGRLVPIWGKDAEYMSELEGIFRAIGCDPIVHLYHVDPIEEILEKLSVKEDLIFNACLGIDGHEVAKLVEKFGFFHTVGLNARFFSESRERVTMRNLLAKSKLRIPNGFVLTKETAGRVDDLLGETEMEFPVYVKPATCRAQPQGLHSGRKIDDLESLKDLVKSLGQDEVALVEEFIEGSEYRILVAGDARDPNADVIVFPPVQDLSGHPAPEANQGLFRKAQGSTKAVGKGKYCSMKSDALMLQMDIQDLARRAFVAVHGSCYGIVTVIDKRPKSEESTMAPAYYGGNELFVVGVSGDVKFGENAKAGIVLSLANQCVENLFAWLLKRPVKA